MRIMLPKNITTTASKLLIAALCFIMAFFAMPDNASADTVSNGGGYAATGQIENTGYSTQLYDASNGLPTSDSNYVLASKDGYIWIAGYSGIIRYDGSSFTRMDTANGLTNGRSMFEDSKGRIWVGTNDNGVVVIEGDKQTHITYKDGLEPSSIRTFAEDNEGNIFVGTTAGVYCIDTEMNVSFPNNKSLAEERILRLDSDRNGVIYGLTNSGLIFNIIDGSIAAIYDSEKLGTGMISSIMADHEHPGEVWLGTNTGTVFHGRFGAGVSEMKSISVDPLTEVTWISYDCNRLWIASPDSVGFLDDKYTIHVISIPLNNGIEMMTSDYQGNMWFASYNRGVMKIVPNNFVDITQNAGIPEAVTNATCFYHDDLYIGTDKGLEILDKDKHAVTSDLTEYIGDSRVRCIVSGAEDDLWIGMYTNDLGLLHLLPNGTFTSYTTANGMPDNSIRCIKVTEDGTVLVGSNGGLTTIKDGKITRTINETDGLKSTVVLTVESVDGVIYAGTDGGGIFTSGESGITQIGREDGLTSDVIMRIKHDADRNVLWFITSNSIEYYQSGLIRQVTTFPYNNNYDLYFDNSDNIWIISSYGIYMVYADSMIQDNVTDYRLYTTENGLTGTPTTLSYSALDGDGYLYIPVRNGVSRVNIDRFSEAETPIKAAVSSIYCGDTQVFADETGTYTIPSTDGRIRISAAVLDYTLLNPEVKVYLEGHEDDGIKVERSNLQPLEYTGLKYGNYKLHICVMDSNGTDTLLDEQFHIVKKPGFWEMTIVRVILLLVLILITVLVVWRIMSNTIIRRQYAEIRQAKEEAEQAGSAKTRFLANMSHEIRTPINTIMGMNEMVMREDATDVPKEYFMSVMNYSFDIRNASESLLTLINNILDISKIESGEMKLAEEEYSTQALLRSIVSMIRAKSTDKQLTFDVAVDEMLPAIMYGDHGKIKQIILNLLSNAVKYTDEGGFTLSVSMVERTDDNVTLRFSVKDTGIGIKATDMEQIFTSYELLGSQNDLDARGTGLGLDISRRFAELMNASLTCESEYGKGSEFFLILPQKIVDPTPIGIFSEQGEGDYVNGPYTPQFVAPDADILVVDNNSMNLTVIKHLLRSTRVFVSTASSGAECLDKLRDTAFNVVLLDQMISGIDDMETIDRIRQLYPDLPVYALTANATEDEDFYISKGFNGYLSKPINSYVLEQTIMKHLPEEMMEKPAVTEQKNDLTEIPPEMSWLYETEGLDVVEGIKNSAGVSTYLFSLNLFLDTIDPNVSVIRDALINGDIRLFTVKVHSLSSSANIIGATELSKMAVALENAGNKKDMAFIESNARNLLREYESFKDKLSRLHKGDS